MLKACQYCGRIHDKKFECSAKARTMQERDAVQRERNSRIRKFRDSAEWQHMRKAIRSRDIGLCLICRDELERLGIRSGALIGTEVHHIEPLTDDFEKRMDEDNLITLCRQHHEEAEAGEYSPEYLRSLACKSSK